MKAPWRLAASHTHLYPGASLRCLDEESRRCFASGDAAAIEFTDGVVAMARLDNAGAATAQLSVQAHRTRRGAAIAAKRWLLVPSGAHGGLRVKARLR